MTSQEKLFKINKAIFSYHTESFADNISSKLND